MTKGPKGFSIPRTLKAAKLRKLKDAKLDDAAFSRMLANGPISITDSVPVGHLWRLGEVHDNMVYACYKTKTQQCHWVEVPSDNIPDWDPDGPQ
jgi:hypothetical protein